MAQVRPPAGGAGRRGIPDVERSDRVDAVSPDLDRASPLVALTFIAYCLARPSKGWGMFWAGAVPEAGSRILHDLTGLAEWWLYAALIPVAALAAAGVEQEADEEQATAHKPDGAAHPAPE